MTKPENKILIIITTAAAAFFLAWIFLLYLAVEKATAISIKNQDLKSLSDEEAKLAILSSSVLKTAAQRAGLNDYFYNTDSILNLIELLEDIGRRAGVELEFSDIKTDEKLSLNLKTSGDLTATKEFLRLIEVAPVLNQPQKILLQEKIIVDEDGSQKTVWLGDLTLAILSFDANNQ